MFSITIEKCIRFCTNEKTPKSVCKRMPCISTLTTNFCLFYASPPTFNRKLKKTKKFCLCCDRFCVFVSTSRDEKLDIAWKRFQIFEPHL